MQGAHRVSHIPDLCATLRDEQDRVDVRETKVREVYVVLHTHGGRATPGLEKCAGPHAGISNRT